MSTRRCSLLLFLIGFIGCQPDSPIPGTSTEPGASTTPRSVDVSLALNWRAEAEHGGFYAALVHGYFADEGLNVTIIPGGPKAPVIPLVADGKYDFGVDNADKVLLLRAQQADVVAVMAPIQDSPRCIMVHRKSGLNRLEDLAGTKKFTLAINPGQPFTQWLKKKVNLDHIQVVQYGGSIVPFLEETDYGQQAYSFSEPFLASGKESDPQCLMLSGIGFNTYTSVLLTRREMIGKRADVVAKMTRASIRGWKKYLAEPAETNVRIHKDNAEMGVEILAFGARELKPLCLPERFDESRFGEMSAGRWQTLVSQMTEIGLLKPDSVKAGESFTCEFVIPEVNRFEGSNSQ